MKDKEQTSINFNLSSESFLSTVLYTVTNVLLANKTSCVAGDNAVTVLQASLVHNIDHMQVV